MCETETETEITPLVHCGASGFIMLLYEILESARHDRTNLLPEMPEKEHAPPTECCGGAVRDLGGCVDGWVVWVLEETGGWREASPVLLPASPTNGEVSYDCQRTLLPHLSAPAYFSLKSRPGRDR